jgi:hypothetical protein
LLAERQTRGQPRAFVEYANLLADWRREVTRISSKLGIDLGTRDKAAIEEFLKPDLRRQRNSAPATNLFGTVWISQAFDAMCAAAEDEPLDEPSLDRVFEADPYRRRYAKQRRLSESAVTNGSNPSRRIGPPAEKAADSCNAQGN